MTLWLADYLASASNVHSLELIASFRNNKILSLTQNNEMFSMLY